MGFGSCRRLVCGAAIVAAVVPGVASCSTHRDQATGNSATSPVGSSTNQAAATAPPGVVAVSPAGVTTRINLPARSTEDEYFQACHAAKAWMQGHQSDRQALVEAYLAAVQAPGAVGAGTWNTPWATLPLARQAAVIVAARAAANGDCG